jgi:DNA-binding NarL/FixJ family response regulator
MSQKIKVLLVDDHPLVREGLVNLINQQADLQICGEAGNEPQALELIRTVQPHVAIVDISLESGSGIELIKSIKALFPAVTVLVLSMHDESLYAERALRAGARGYVISARQKFCATSQIRVSSVATMTSLSDLAFWHCSTTC